MFFERTNGKSQIVHANKSSLLRPANCRRVFSTARFLKKLAKICGGFREFATLRLRVGPAGFSVAEEGFQ